MASTSKSLTETKEIADLAGHEAIDRDGSPTLSEAKRLWMETKSATKHESKRKNLDLLWEVLEGLRKSGAEKFTLAEVGRALEKKGGPKVQSLRNSQGLDFRKIIDAYVGAVLAGKSEASATSMDRAIAMIPDSSLRSILRAGQSEMARLKNENDMLRRAFKSLSLPGFPQNKEKTVSVAEEGISAETRGCTPLKPSHLKALKKGMDKERLSERGMAVREDGAVLDEHGIALFPPGFADAIRAILSAESGA